MGSCLSQFLQIQSTFGNLQPQLTARTTNRKQYSFPLFISTRRARLQISKVPIGLFIINCTTGVVTITTLAGSDDNYFKTQPQQRPNLFLPNGTDTRTNLDSNSWQVPFMVN